MVPSGCHFGRFLVAFVAVVGQFIPVSAVWACGKSCCSASTSQSCCKSVLSNEQDPASQCPLCRAERTDRRPAPPCHCHLKARHESATTAKGRAELDFQVSQHFEVVRIYDDSAEASAELTRLAIAAGDTIPYRPPRIVFGVWRN
jgi:hypothetical protein